MRRDLLLNFAMACVGLVMFAGCQSAEDQMGGDAEVKSPLAIAKAAFSNNQLLTKFGGSSIIPQNYNPDWDNSAIVTDDGGTAVNVPLPDGTKLEFNFYRENKNLFCYILADQQLVYIVKDDETLTGEYIMTKVRRNALVGYNGEFGGFSSNEIIVGTNLEPASVNRFNGFIFWHKLDGTLVRVQEYVEGRKNNKLTFEIKPLDLKNDLYSLFFDPKDLIRRVEPVVIANTVICISIRGNHYQTITAALILIKSVLSAPHKDPNAPSGGSGTTELWDKKTHKTMIEKAFDGILTATQINLVQKGSNKADGFGYQFVQSNHMHGLSRSYEQLEDAIAKTKGFFLTQLKIYQFSPDENEKWIALGMALHPIMDFYSPFHRFSEYNMVKDGLEHLIGGETYENYTVDADMAVGAISSIYHDLNNRGVKPGAVFDNWIKSVIDMFAK